MHPQFWESMRMLSSPDALRNRADMLNIVTDKANRELDVTSLDGMPITANQMYRAIQMRLLNSFCWPLCHLNFASPTKSP